MGKNQNCIRCKYSIKKRDENCFWFACMKTGKEPIAFQNRKNNNCPLSYVQYKLALEKDKIFFLMLKRTRF